MAVGQNGATVGECFLAATLQQGWESVLPFGDLAPLLRAHELTVWEFFQSHIGQFGSLPHYDTVVNKTQVFLPATVVEPASFYFDALQKRFITDRIQEAVTAANSYLPKGGPDPQKAYDAMMDVLMRVPAVCNGRRMRDALHTGQIVFDEIQWVKGKYHHGIPRTGWPYFDEMNGGLRPGDLLGVVGRISQGKTMLALHIARHNWERLHKKILFVSMEMSAEEILIRLAGMETGIEARNIKTAHVSTKQEEKILALEMGLADRPTFYVTDGSLTATPQEVERIVQQIHPDLLVIDGAYLMRHSDPRLHGHAKVAEVTLDIRRLLLNQGIPGVASWQLNREATKLKPGEQIGLEHIASSDEIGRSCYAVLGVFDDETIKAQLRRKLNILKGRGGEKGEFLIHWNFAQMDFSQVPIDMHEQEPPDPDWDA